MKIINTSGKRKTAIARACLKPGKGKIRINRQLLELHEPHICQQRIMEPAILAGDIVSKVDVDLKVFGGGLTCQADAARLALARALVEFNKGLEKIFLGYDRQLLVADVRRKETHKPNCHGKSRAKRQKSYR